MEVKLIPLFLRPGIHGLQDLALSHRQVNGRVLLAMFDHRSRILSPDPAKACPE